MIYLIAVLAFATAGLVAWAVCLTPAEESTR